MYMGMSYILQASRHPCGMYKVGRLSLCPATLCCLMPASQLTTLCLSPVPHLPQSHLSHPLYPHARVAAYLTTHLHASPLSHACPSLSLPPLCPTPQPTSLPLPYPVPTPGLTLAMAHGSCRCLSLHDHPTLCPIILVHSYTFSDHK